MFAALVRRNIEISTARGVNVPASYWPAYMLSDWSLERAGRVQKEKSVPAAALSPSQQCDAATTAATKAEESKEIIGTAKYPASSDRKVLTTAMIIIGDEILNGFTTDLNLQVATKALSSIGVPLKKVESIVHFFSLLKYY